MELYKLRILELMERNNMTIYQLSGNIDLSQAGIQNWFSAKNASPTLDSLKKICSHFDITLSQLFLDNTESYYPVNEKVKRLLYLLYTHNEDKQNAFIDLFMRVLE